MRALAVACVLASCHPHPVAAHHDVVVLVSDAGDACDNACARMRALGCVEAEPTPAGESCEAFCERTADLLSARCVARVTTLDEAQRCGVCL